jgi:16S rRNA (cytosine1402-N4)-methyltransferase
MTNALLGWQLDRAERGFSFMRDGPLDMRMGGGGPGAELNGGPGAESLNFMSAEALVNTADEAELGRLIRDWGEERGWRRIAAR